MFIGYLHCNRCAFRTEEFMCMYHFWRDGFHVPVQDQQTLAIRLIQVPDDDVFDAINHPMSKADRKEAVQQYVKSVIARNITSTETKIPILDLLQKKPVHVPCPKCHAMLAWKTTGIT